MYGTLRRGCDNKFARLLSEKAQYLSSACVPGRLYDFYAYPGAVPSDEPEQWVHGEIHLLQDPTLLALLDEYEGSEYERVAMPIKAGGATIECWIYWYIGPVTAPMIASGDWKAH